MGATHITKKRKKRRKMKNLRITKKNKIATVKLETKLTELDNVLDVYPEIEDALKMRIRKINKKTRNAAKYLATVDFPPGYEDIKTKHPYCWTYRTSRETMPDSYYMFGSSKYGMEVHRLTWVVFKNQGNTLSDGRSTHVAHLCNNKWCVNPNHLVAIPNRENQKHKAVHGVGTCKTKPHKNQKVSIENVEKIRNMYATGEFTQQELATMFNVARQTITQITLGNVFKDVDGERTKNFDKTVSGSQQVTKKKRQQILQIRALYEKGLTQAQLAKLFGVSQMNISYVVRGIYFSEVK
jgi:DNA-binding XRE family transcriptional regulator